MFDGGDLFMPGKAEDIQSILEALADGSLSRTALEASASRVLRMCRRLGKTETKE